MHRGRAERIAAQPMQARLVREASSRRKTTDAAHSATAQALILLASLCCLCCSDIRHSLYAFILAMVVWVVRAHAEHAVATRLAMRSQPAVWVRSCSLAAAMLSLVYFSLSPLFLCVRPGSSYSTRTCTVHSTVSCSSHLTQPSTSENSRKRTNSLWPLSHASSPVLLLGSLLSGPHCSPSKHTSSMLIHCLRFTLIATLGLNRSRACIDTVSRSAPAAAAASGCF